MMESECVKPGSIIPYDGKNPPPLTVQHGGSHYKLPIQPIEYIMKNNLSYAQGNVIKYVTRYRDKNGLEDLKKAKHYIDFLIEELINE